ncbi:SusD/RagB family nutrient-binding outer membrane lipoprotein [Myroides marinus]|uniref:SusD/RagB family nutrient-binding outer membrane lipoprotein n=1 Tax=Myroides marinus TaxID=703342 RepID=UPI002576A51F|nr:SusD/RagB family nutrient-binding outer membrane lipoprotein [Myroides marinus]MDM1368137.1 SusD/RagB family nutrient-binding outer membrane lipoprotein [Myroides marinus]MDM1372183.1 SusD/RagB family nutrient-binding outer membrane lipoprotein [Myroides marinus]MDM1375112.1 SusD/RagB family nutrient-binding outer membrane lipoprotein [Myroides marinus]MDM1383283.1 SusD/RagB family nutrient-binding outer membrane lipoprotein [Myroides marinus]MDM1389844.1 SusD/RagB family nutrient-binding o
MKKIKYIILSVVSSAFLLQSCSEDKMDDINGNKNNPEYVESKYILTDVMTNTSFSVVGADLAYYASIYTELLGGGYAQMYNAQIRDGEPQLSSTYNNSWNNIYRNLRSLKMIREKCAPGGSEVGNYHTLGIAEIMNAYNLAVLTDLWGDVPYSEALSPKGNPQAKLDKQKDIYLEIFRLLDSGIENLKKQSDYPNLTKQDLIFSGNLDKWIKTAYGLKARYLMRLSAVNPNYQGVLDNIALSFGSSAEDFSFRDAKVSYTFYLFRVDRDNLYGSKTFYDLLKNYDEKDPRLIDYFVANKGKTNLIDHSGNVVQSQGEYVRSGLSEGSANKNNAIYLLSYHEILFLKAEAQARLGNNAEAVKTLNLAIKAGLTKKQSLTYPTYNREVADGLTGQALLKRIANEKYISFYEIESIEAYNDIRRWKAMGENLIELKHKDPNKFPKRYSYGNSDVTNNDHIKAIFGDGSYVYSEDVWWAKGTR